MQSLPSDQSSSSVDAAAFRNAMREVASGVTIVSSGRCDDARGLTATAFSSLSAEPPSVLVCINRNSECHLTIFETGTFCVNILRDADQPLASRFAGREGVRGHTRFQEGEWTTLATGAPALSTALATFDCRLTQAIEAGSHTIFIGEVAAVSTTSGNALVYRAGEFHAVA